jgi:outer membrane receptor protein involved in Fe transport
MRSLACAALALPGVAWADAGPTESQNEVVVTAPLPGSELPSDRVATWTQGLDAAQIERNGPPAVLAAMERWLAGVSLGQAQANPFQPNLFFRGFQASPLAGDSQGLAVYLDGARFNQPFGDTVDWDLIPDEAVSSITLEGSAPAFGLNALGGAISVRLKTGFSDPTSEASASGGSFGRWSAEAQHGGADGARSVFLMAAVSHDGGWRDFSPSDLRQGYLDLGWRRGEAEAHFSLLGADNSLTGDGPSPVELLAADRSAVFTHPDSTENRYLRAQATGQAAIGGDWSLHALAYAARLDQSTANADVSDVEACVDQPGLLCLSGEPARDSSGAPIPDVLNGGPYAQLNRTTTRSYAFGASAQLSSMARLAGRPNNAALGVSLDGGRTRFSASSELGAMTQDRGFGAPIAFIDQPDGSIAPVGVDADSLYFGVYLQDVLDLTSALSIDASARANFARLDLHDLLGQDLNGRHSYGRLNPAIGADYRLSPAATLYLGFSEANRAPTPAEISCASPDRPCSLTNFFVGDPDLRQVTAHTWEAGVKGKAMAAGLSIRWNLDAFRTTSRNEIILVSSELHGRAFFQNVGATRRQGVTANLELRSKRLTAWAAYAYTDARFLTGLVLNSPDNPEAAPDGTIEVRPGAHMPGTPAHRLKLGLDYDVTSRLHVGFDGIISSGAVLFGDEANLTPKTSPYAVFGLNAAYRVTASTELFGEITNLGDARYATYGTFCPTSQAPIPEAPGASDPRCLSPGAPRTFRIGVRIGG